MASPAEPEATAEVVRLAVSGLNEARIARALVPPKDRKWVRGVLARAEADRVISRLSGGGRGRPKVYGPGPAYSPSATTGGWSPVPPPPETAAPGEDIDLALRVHAWRFTLPVFADQMAYRDAHGIRHPWHVGDWTGDAKVWTACRLHGRDCGCSRATSHYLFTERTGRWVWTPLKQPVAVQPPGRAARARRQVATVVLMPAHVWVQPDALEREKEMALAAALDLVRDIRENRGLAISGIPLQVQDTEFAKPVGPTDAFPPGKTEVAPGLWIDHSPPDKTPEVESKDALRARRLVTDLVTLKKAADLPEDIAAIRSELRGLRSLVEEVLRRLDGRMA